MTGKKVRKKDSGGTDFWHYSDYAVYYYWSSGNFSGISFHQGSIIPPSIETIELDGEGKNTVKPGDILTILTMNTGYAALDKDHDFFMDGGLECQCDSPEQVRRNTGRHCGNH